MKYSLYKSIAAAATVLFTVAACQTEEVFQVGEPDVEGCYGVYFPSQEVSGSHTLDPSAEKVITVKVARTNTEGDIVVPIDTTSNVSNIFQIDEISFADGQKETEVEITFDDIEIGVQSSLNISISDPQYASNYGTGATAISFSVMCVKYEYLCEPGTETKAKVHWTQNYWGETCDSYIKYYEIDGVRHCVTETIPDSHVYKGEPYFGYGFWGQAENETDEIIEREFIWYTEDKNKDGNYPIELPLQKVVLYPGVGYIYTSDYLNFYFDGLGRPSILVDDTTYKTWLDAAKALGHIGGTLPVSYYDGNGGFYFAPLGYASLDFFNGNSNSGFAFLYGEVDEIGIASGFTRVDYKISVAADLAVAGKLPVYLNLGADVDEVRYEVYEGALSSAVAKNKVEEIANNKAAKSYKVDDSKGFVLTLDKSGEYTIVALSYAEGEYKGEYDAVSFNYVTADDAETYAAVVSVGTEDISERYEAYGDKTNAFGFWIAGKDLTDVHMLITKTASIKGKEDLYYSALKADEDGEFALDTTTVKLINSVGGYADIVTELSALTSYTVLVWASNGHQETFTSAEYTTDGLPNEVIIDGKGAYLYDGVFSGWDEGLNLEFNPNTNQYEIPNWGYGVNFKFTVAKDGSVHVPFQSTGATYPDYGSIYVYEASDTDKIFGDGAAEYFELDTSHKSYKDEDGNYHFYVVYAVSVGVLVEDTVEEVFYVAGKPAGAPEPEAASLTVSKSACGSEGKIAGVRYERQTYNAVSAVSSELVRTKAHKDAPTAKFELNLR